VSNLGTEQRQTHPPSQPATTPRPSLPPQATKIRESGALAHLGQAQVWLAAGEPLNASTELEAALKQAPGCQDALKLLAGLRAELPAKKADALVDHFRTGAAKAPDEPGSWAMLGELLAASNPAGGWRQGCCC
jgi:Tfp pilus assembly protein PilF